MVIICPSKQLVFDGGCRLYPVNALFPLVNKKIKLLWPMVAKKGNPKTRREKAEAERHQQPPQSQDVR